MNARIGCGRFLIRLGSFIRSLAVAVMKPNDLIHFNRLYYSSSSALGAYCQDATIKQGLWPEEKELLLKTSLSGGKVAVLGVGGGRIAIELACRGFEVTGVDFIPEMIARAKRHAESQGVQFRGIVQELTALDLEVNNYDAIWMPASLYSYFPTRKLRIILLARIRESLKPGGFLLLRFFCGRPGPKNSIAESLKMIVGVLSGGNRGYEWGDMILNNREFIHMFPTETHLRSEFHLGGFAIEYMEIQKDSKRGQAILKKPLDNDKEEQGQSVL